MRVRRCRRRGDSLDKIIFSAIGIMLPAVNVYAESKFSLEDGSGAPIMAIMLFVVAIAIAVGAMIAVKSLTGIKKSGVVGKSEEEGEKRFSRVFSNKEETLFRKKPKKETTE